MLHREPEYRRRRRQEAEENQRYADREWNESTNESYVKQITSSIDGVTQNLERAQYTQHAQERRERKLKYGEIGGLWVAAIVGIVAIVFGNMDSSAQRQVLINQIFEMQIARRPWIKIDFEPVFLAKDAVGLHFNIKAIVQNIGHSPAKYVFISPELIPFDFDQAIAEEHRVCDDTKASWDRIKKLDGVVFPGQPQFQIENTTSFLKDIVRYQNELLEKYTKYGRIFTDSEINYYRSVAEFVLVGCVSYEFDGSPDIHQTGFIANIGLKDSNRLSAPVDLSKDKTIDAGNVYFGQTLIGAFAN